jgi:uncharacterized protein YuzE
MNLTYDPEHNIAYIRLRERQGEVETLRISDELNVDMAPDGTVYGIELLNANEQLTGVDGRRLVVVDEPDGRTRELALT